jgi:hypothetical protein
MDLNPMRSRTWRGPAALALLTLPFPGLAAAQDLTVVQKLTQDKNPPVVMTSYVGSDRIRWALPDGNEVMVEATGGKFTLVDHKKKEYAVITQQDLDAMAAEMQARMKEMDEKMKNMPPQMREKLAGMMGGAAAAIDVQKGAGGRTIAGYTCQNWTITVSNFSRTEQCVTTDLALPAKAWENFQAFANRMRSVASPMSKMVESLQEKMKQMNGLSLATTTTTTVLGKSTTSSAEVTEIKKGPVPASAWDLPAGYRQGPSPFKRK